MKDILHSVQKAVVSFTRLFLVTLFTPTHTLGSITQFSHLLMESLWLFVPQPKMSCLCGFFFI